MANAWPSYLTSSPLALLAAFFASSPPSPRSFLPCLFSRLIAYAKRAHTQPYTHSHRQGVPFRKVAAPFRTAHRLFSAASRSQIIINTMLRPRPSQSRPSTTALVHRFLPQPHQTRPTTSTATTRVLTFKRGSRLLAFCSFIAAATQDLKALSSSPSSCHPAFSSSGAPRRRPTSSYPSNPNDGDDDEEEGILARALGPLGGEITLGGALGFGAGYSLKKIGKAAAFFIGLAFVASQTLGHLGYVEINWRKVEREVMRLFDLDGDEKLTSRDLALYWEKAKKVLMHKLPSTTAFAAMFALGLQKG